MRLSDGRRRQCDENRADEFERRTEYDAGARRESVPSADWVPGTAFESAEVGVPSILGDATVGRGEHRRRGQVRTAVESTPISDAFAAASIR